MQIPKSLHPNVHTYLLYSILYSCIYFTALYFITHLLFNILYSLIYCTLYCILVSTVLYDVDQILVFIELQTVYPYLLYFHFYCTLYCILISTVLYTIHILISTIYLQYSILNTILTNRIYCTLYCILYSLFPTHSILQCTCTVLLSEVAEKFATWQQCTLAAACQNQTKCRTAGRGLCCAIRPIQLFVVAEIDHHPLP